VTAQVWKSAVLTWRNSRLPLTAVGINLGVEEKLPVPICARWLSPQQKARSSSMAMPQVW
jgi:hypothetical protein